MVFQQTDPVTVLVIAAHPDDEVLGCGGIIPQLTSAGHNVYLSLLCEGITGRYPKREQADSALIESVHASSLKAAKALGIKDVITQDLPDQRLDTIPLLEITKLIEDLIAQLAPQVIFTHHGSDINFDHLIAHRATLTATRPVQGHPVREVYAFEVPASTEWAFQRFEPAFRPNVFVDISDTLDIKIQAMSYYETETRSYPHPRSLESIRILAKRWGSLILS